MISNTKKKAIYKSALAVLLGGTMLSGCGNSEEPTKGKEEVTDSTEEKAEKQEEEYQFPTEIMTPEETSNLTVNQFIAKENLTKLPDAVVLENSDLAYVRLYKYVCVADGSDITNAFGDPEIETELDRQPSCYDFLGIQILPVDEYFLDHELVWHKFVLYEGGHVDAGTVITDAKVKELDGKEKNLHR